MDNNQLSRASIDSSEAIFGIFDLLEDVIHALDEISIRNCLGESTSQELSDKLWAVKENYYGV
jgi:hypothetical protein